MASCSPSRADCSPPKKGKSKSDAHRMNAINNNVLRMSPRRQANVFAEWFRRLMDDDRASLCLYLSEDALLHWFGRTIKTKMKISGFLKYEMNSTHHRFNSVEVCGPINVRGEDVERICEKIPIEKKDDEVLASPLRGDTPGVLNSCLSRFSLRSLSVKRNRALSSSPESPTSVVSSAKKSKYATSPIHGGKLDTVEEGLPKGFTSSDGKRMVLKKGQGDCLLPTSYVDIRCIIEYTRVKNKRDSEFLKWKRQCKLQVAYTEDPLHAGEYIIWTIVYSHNNKCRRNLLSAFEAVSNECEKTS